MLGWYSCAVWSHQNLANSFSGVSSKRWLIVGVAVICPLCNNGIGLPIDSTCTFPATTAAPDMSVVHCDMQHHSMAVHTVPRLQKGAALRPLAVEDVTCKGHMRHVQSMHASHLHVEVRGNVDDKRHLTAIGTLHPATQQRACSASQKL
jgi:hypothetical protein